MPAGPSVSGEPVGACSGALSPYTDQYGGAASGNIRRPSARHRYPGARPVVPRAVRRPRIGADCGSSHRAFHAVGAGRRIDRRLSGRMGGQRHHLVYEHLPGPALHQRDDRPCRDFGPGRVQPAAGACSDIVGKLFTGGAQQRAASAGGSICGGGAVPGSGTAADHHPLSAAESAAGDRGTVYNPRGRCCPFGRLPQFSGTGYPTADP